MAHIRLIVADDIVQTAARMIEASEGQELSLRAVAASLGVKAPSLYRYFEHKEALERAVVEEILLRLLAYMRDPITQEAAELKFQAVVEAYLRFAREHFSLYSFVMNRVPQTQGSAIAKKVWNLLLDAASGVSGRADDTSAAVAVWSLLHGYATLEHSGAFGTSGPKDGLTLAIAAFLEHFRRAAVPPSEGQRTSTSKATAKKARAG